LLFASPAQVRILLFIFSFCIKLFSIRVAGEADLKIKVLGCVSLDLAFNFEQKSVVFKADLRHNAVIMDVKLSGVLFE